MTLKKHPKRKLCISSLTKTNETPCPSQTFSRQTQTNKTYNNNKTTTYFLLRNRTPSSLIMQVRAIPIFDKFEIVFF